MLHHHLGLLLDVVRVQIGELRQRPVASFLRQIRIFLDRFDEPEPPLVNGVVLHHVEDEALLDGLAH